MALATNALTNVATIEDELGISSGTEDARLQRMINEASAIVESYTGRSFYRDTAVEEKVLGWEGPYLFLAKPPVHSITSISYLGSDLSSSDYEIHGDGKAGIVYAISGSWARLSVDYADISRTKTNMVRKAYTATYDGGWYTQPQDDADDDITRDLPYDIERACIMIVSYLRRSMGRDPTVKSESLLDSSVSYTAGATSQGVAVPWLQSAIPGAAAILNTYKKGILY